MIKQKWFFISKYAILATRVDLMIQIDDAGSGSLGGMYRSLLII